MRRGWLVCAWLCACGPVVGVPGESAEGSASAASTGVDTGLDATSAAATGADTSGPGSTSPGTTSPGTSGPVTSEGDTSAGEASASTGGDESTGAEPAICARDATPIGAGAIEWESGDEPLEVFAADVAVDADGVTLVGHSPIDVGAATIARFDLAGGKLWSQSWWPP